MIKIIEQSSISKTGDNSHNEDGIFVSENYIAVIDGATSKNSNMYNGHTGGQVIRDIIIDTLETLDGNESYTLGIRKIQNEIEARFPASKFFHAAASAVIYSIKSKTIWMIGDCQACVNGRRFSNNKIIDEILSQTRSIAISAFIKEGKTVSALLEEDLGRELILPFLKLQRVFENSNSKFGYATFNNVEMSDEIIQSKIVTINVQDYSEVILASDGYPHLLPTLSDSEDALAKILKEDPLCYKIYLSTKGLRSNNLSFDDRSYIRFKT